MPPNRPPLPPTLTIPGMGLAHLDPSEEGAGPSYTRTEPTHTGPLTATSVALMLPRYTPLNLDAYTRHMAELWAELPAALDRVRSRMHSAITDEIAEFTHRDAAACKPESDLIFNPLRLRQVCLYPDERYWRWWRTPALIIKEGLLETAIGLWIGNQCYQLEIDTGRISESIGGHDLLVSGARHLNQLGVEFQG